MLRMMWPLVMVVGMVNVDAAEAAVNASGVSEVFWEAVGRVSVKQVVKSSPQSGLNSSCFNAAEGYSNLRTCLRSQCVSGDDVARLYGVTSDEGLEGGDLSRVSAGLMYVLTQKSSCSSEVSEHHDPPTSAAVWGYGFLFVTLINVCSLLGACVLPCVHSAIYRVLLLFMVALAVGTLVGSGLLVLIPEALELPAGEEHQKFLWKMTTVMGGVYLFFLVERGMRIINDRRENSPEKKQRSQQAMEGTYTSFFQRQSPDPHPLPYPQGKGGRGDASSAFSNCAFVGCEGGEGGRCEQTGCSHQPPSTASLVALDECANNMDDSGQNGNSNAPTSNVTATPTSSPGGESEEGGSPVRIAPVAYMIIFGDALHNLIDGLSIGAAFTESTLLGISLSVAVMCEELPHELGDFAILLNSGMSMRKALLYNFLSSLSCYVGLVIGIQLGENTSANTWIFAIAGGMFLYISLADMLPEMNSAAESQEGRELGQVKTLLVQNFGLLLGFGIILLLAVFGEHIKFE